MAKNSKYQQQIIKNYYQNREAIALQRIQELVTELYLAAGKKRARHWQTLANHLSQVGVKQDAIDHLISQDNPELVANLVEQLINKQ